MSHTQFPVFTIKIGCSDVRFRFYGNQIKISVMMAPPVGSTKQALR